MSNTHVHEIFAGFFHVASGDAVRAATPTDWERDFARQFAEAVPLERQPLVRVDADKVRLGKDLRVSANDEGGLE